MECVRLATNYQRQVPTRLLTFGGSAGSIDVVVANECRAGTWVCRCPVVICSSAVLTCFANVMVLPTWTVDQHLFQPGCRLFNILVRLPLLPKLTPSPWGIIQIRLIAGVCSGANHTSVRVQNTILCYVLVTHQVTCVNVVTRWNHQCNNTAHPPSVFGGSNDGFSTARLVSAPAGFQMLLFGRLLAHQPFAAAYRIIFPLSLQGKCNNRYREQCRPVQPSWTGLGYINHIVRFAGTGGNVSLTIATRRVHLLALWEASCLFYAGANNDGFSVTNVLNISPPVELVSFTGVESDNGTTDLENCIRTNNDFHRRKIFRCREFVP